MIKRLVAAPKSGEKEQNWWGKHRIQVGWGLALTLTVVAALLRRKSLGSQSLWFDEADLVARAQRDIGSLLAEFARPGENGPLYTLLMHFWVQIAGTGEAALRTPSMLAGVALVPLIYQFGSRFLGGRSVGLIAATLITFSPYQIFYSQDAKMYPLMLLGVVASLYLFLEALQHESWKWWVAYLLVTVAAIYIHLMAAFIVGVELVYFFSITGGWTKLYNLVRRKNIPIPDSELSSTSHKRARLVFGLLLLPYLPIALWQGWAILQGGVGKTWLEPVGLLPMLDTLARRFSVNRLPDAWLEGLGALLYVALVISGLRAIWQVRRIVPGARQRAVLLTTWLLLPLVGFYLLTLRIPLFTERYLLLISPAFYLLAAWGLVWLLRRFTPLAMAAGATALVLSVVGLFSVIYSEEAQKEDWRAAMQWLQPQLRPGDEIILLPGYTRSAVDYYLKSTEVPIYTVPANLLDGSDMRGLTSHLVGENGIMRDHERAWLIISPERYRKDDPTEYLRETFFRWNTWTFEHAQQFVGISIHGYAFKQITGTNADFYPRNTANNASLQAGNSLKLEGYDLVATAQPNRVNLLPNQVAYDSYLHLSFYWRKTAPDPTSYDMRLRLLDKNGNDTGTAYTGPPLSGYHPTSQWKVGEALRDYRDIYIKVPPGEYRLELAIYPAGNPGQLLPITGSASFAPTQFTTPQAVLLLPDIIRVN